MRTILILCILITSITFSQTAFLSGSDSILTKAGGTVVTVNTTIFVKDSADGKIDSLVVEVYDTQTGEWGRTGVYSGDGNTWDIVPGDGNGRWYYCTRWFTIGGSQGLRIRRTNIEAGELARRTEVSLGGQSGF